MVDKTRNYQLDNAKGALIVLVFYAHFIGNILKGAGILNSPIWAIINSFHMCTFLIISGYLSKNRIDNKRYDKAITSCFIPYLFAQFAMFLLFAISGTLKDFFLVDNSNYMVWLRPNGALWYIWALGLYLIVTPLLIKYFKKKSRLLVFSIVLALVMGLLYTVWYFRFTKVICFYPFFLVGYFISDFDLKAIFDSIKVKIVSLVLFIGLITIMTTLFFKLRSQMVLTGLISMEEKGRYADYVGKQADFILIGPLSRICVIAIAIACALCFIFMMPKIKTIFSYLGKYSIYVYVLHWIIIRGILVLKVKGLAEPIDSIIGFLNKGYNVIWIVLPTVIIVSFILSSKPVRKVCRPFLEPNINLSRLFSTIHNSDV